MTASASPGYSFRANEEVTASKANRLWGSDNGDGTYLVSFVTGMSQTEMASGAGLLILSATAPSDTDAIWIDSNSDMVRLYDSGSSVWRPTRGALLTNKSGVDLARGDVVIVDTANDDSVTTTTSAGSSRMPMVAAETIANNATGQFWIRGKAFVNLDAAGTLSQRIRTATTAKKANPISAIHGNLFGILLSSGTSLVPCLLFGKPVP